MKEIFNIKKSPYVLLLFAAIALLIALVIYPMTNIAFQDKTMFGIPLAIMAWIIPLLLISIWILYLLTRRFLYSTAITWMHVLITVFATILIVSVLYIGINSSPNVNGRQEFIGKAMQILSVIFVSGQLIYLANVLSGILGKHKAA